jgi:hypothetical protein
MINETPPLSRVQSIVGCIRHDIGGPLSIDDVGGTD